MNVILTLSGGLDSTVLLFHLLKQGHGVRCLSVDYGQRHRKELEAAILIARTVKVEHRVLDLSGIRSILGGSSQTDDSVAVPEGHYEEESMKQTVVPNRNAVLLSLAGAWAISTKSDAVAYAAHAGDHAIYPDCREEFVKPFAEAMWNADWHHVKVERPFLTMTKADIVKLGASEYAPLGMTYSCYKGGEKHCGECGTDVERKEAFQLAGVTDPTEYEQ
jgi:7-cyano-7-deazaguanine synthase